MEKAKITYKNCVFKVVIQKCENQKMDFFCKNCLTLFVSGREKKRIFVHTICFGQNVLGPKQCKPGNTIKIVVSTEIAQNQKWHLFFLDKGVFDMGEKVGFTNCVFESCVFWKHYFYSVFRETQQLQYKHCM